MGSGVNLHPPRLPTALARALADAGYGEAEACGLLGLRSLAAFQAQLVPAWRRRLADAGARAVATRLFLLGDEVPAEFAAAALGRTALASGRRSGALVQGARGLRATFDVYPCGPLLIAVDSRLTPPAAAEPVMYLGADSYVLAKLAPRAAIPGRVLDLCTGSGVQALVAAAGGAEVRGVDTSVRAVFCARGNATANGLRVGFRRGDLYEGAGRGLALVLANPPFVATPFVGREAVAFRDGGVTGDAVLRRIVAGLPDRLAPGGSAVIITQVPVFGDGSRWDDGVAPGLDLLRFDLRTDPAAAHARLYAFGDEVARADRVARIEAALAREGVVAVALVLLALRRPAERRPALRRSFQVGRRQAIGAGAMEAAWAAADADPRAPLLLSPGLQIEAPDGPAGEGRAWISRGLLGEHRLTVAMRHLLEAMGRGLDQQCALRQVAAARGLAPAELAEMLAPELRAAVAGGLLRPVSPPGAP